MKKFFALLMALCMLFSLMSVTAFAEGENQIIYGSTTELSGDLGNAWWTNNASDKMVRDLIDDYDVVVTNHGGEFVYNDKVVK